MARRGGPINTIKYFEKPPTAKTLLQSSIGRVVLPESTKDVPIAFLVQPLATVHETDLSRARARSR